MPWPFRNPVGGDGDPPEWSPPSYASPVASQQSDEEWKPPEYATAVKTKDEAKPSVFSRAYEGITRPYKELGKYASEKIPEQFHEATSAASKFLEEHPIIRERSQRLLTGTSPEYEEEKKKYGITDIKGPELMKTPGIEALGEKIKNLGIRTGSYYGGALGSIAGDIVSGASTGFDPRTAGIKVPIPSELPIRRARVTREAVPTEELPIRRPNLPSEFIPVGGEEEFNKAFPSEAPTKSSEDILYEASKKKFRMGEEWKPPDYAKPSEKAVEKPSFVNPFEKKLEPEIDLTTQLEAPKPDLEARAAERFGRIYRSEGGFEKAEWKPPSYASAAEVPQAARTESGKLAIGADVKSLGKVLGTSLYKGDIAPIATKELLQNSIDAVRHLGSEGKINVVLDRHNSTIHVADNGKGLTRQELESVFTNLGASGKREDISASGGFGLAKAAPLLGGDKVEVSSITRDSQGVLHEHSFEGTPSELLEGVDIKHRVLPEGTETGTSVKVHVPKDSSFYSARDFVKNLSQHSPNLSSNIRMAERYPGDTSDLNFSTLTRGKGTSLATLDNPSAQTELIEPEGTKRATRTSIELNLSNNGMYQGTKTMYLPQETPNVPSSVTVDIKSKVPEGHVDYPFTANREELRGSVEKQVQEYIDENIIKPGVGKRMDELKKLYNSMPEVTVGKGGFPNIFGRKISIYDPKGQISSSEMSSITSNPAFHTLAGNIASTLDEAMKAAGTPEWSSRLEKVGIIFDDKLHGIHIPNPGENKSAILVNPFIAISKLSPDEASANILHTILHEMAHIEPERAGHNEAFTIRLGDIYGKFGARRSVEAQEQILKSIADPNTGIYHPEIQKILQTYKESRGREATTEDLLSGTGIGSRSERGGKGAIPPSDKPDAEGISSTVDKLFSALSEAKGLNVEQQAINKAERAKRFAAFAGVKEEGAAGAAKSLGKLRGDFEKVQPGEGLGLNPKETDSLFTAVKKANITEGEKARGYTALFKLMNGEQVPVRSELQILDDVFGNDFANKIIELHGGIGAVGLKVSKIANTMKAMQNMLSLAAPLRHGIGLMARKEYYPAFADMFKFFANKESFDASQQAIREGPNYLLKREAGLFTAKPGSLQGSEEEFLRSYIGTSTPILGASPRAYVGFLNKLRDDTSETMLNRAKDLGYEPATITKDASGNIIRTPTKETKAIMRFVNIFSGRGELPFGLEKMTNELNTVLWSPRMMASRIQMFTNPKIYTDLPKGMRLEGLKSLLAVASLGTIIDTALAYAGAKVSYNILSTDFGKSRFGTKLVDPWGGLQQYVVAAARMLAGKTDSPMPTSRLEIAGRFMKNKESPAASLAHTLLTAKVQPHNQPTFSPTGGFTTQYGQKTSIQSEIGKSFAPIFSQDLYDLATSEPKWSDDIGLTAILTGASLAGMSQDYPEKKQGKLQLRKMRLH